MSREVVFRPAALRTLEALDSIDARRISEALNKFADTGHGNIKALKGPLKGRYRLRIGKWRVIFTPIDPQTLLVTDIDNRGEAY